MKSHFPIFFFTAVAVILIGTPWGRADSNSKEISAMHQWIDSVFHPAQAGTEESRFGPLSIKSGLRIIRQDHGIFGINQSCIGTPIHIGSKTFAHGLGVNSVAEIEVVLPADVARFLPGKLKNGDLVAVEQVKDDGQLVLRDGRTIPAHFRQFTHGYATTSHAAQGKTVDHGILVLGEKGYQAANLKQAYVSNSRFRLSQTIHAEEIRREKEGYLPLKTRRERGGIRG